MRVATSQESRACWPKTTFYDNHNHVLQQLLSTFLFKSCLYYVWYIHVVYISHIYNAE